MTGGDSINELIDHVGAGRGPVGLYRDQGHVAEVVPRAAYERMQAASQALDDLVDQAAGGKLVHLDVPRGRFVLVRQDIYEREMYAHSASPEPPSVVPPAINLTINLPPDAIHIAPPSAPIVDALDRVAGELSRPRELILHRDKEQRIDQAVNQPLGVEAAKRQEEQRAAWGAR